MIAELSSWSPGVSLGWALFSLGMGVLILVVIAARLWLELRAQREQQEGD